MLKFRRFTMTITQERLDEMRLRSQQPLDFSDIPPMTDQQLKQATKLILKHPELFQNEQQEFNLVHEDDHSLSTQ